MTEPEMWHRRSSVLRLQQAHAAHIQASYEALVSEPGNPLEAEWVTFGETRVFAIGRTRLENRVLLTGNESGEDLDRIFAYFERRKVGAFIELNPANFLRSRPFSWRSELLPLLLERRCQVQAFRCVWYLDEPPQRADAPRVERYDHSRFDEYSAALEAVYPSEMTDDADWARRTQRGPQWLHYLGFDQHGLPASTETLFLGEGLGFLAWWYTNPSSRSRGHQAAGIRARAADAFDRDCTGAFTVTDFSIQSSQNLQRAGFRLAYNYLLLTWEPAASP